MTTRFEYKVVPAPTRGTKARGVNGVEARFALALESLMNSLGANGWEYQRSDTLPVEERRGLTGRVTTFQNMLIFRRALREEAGGALPPLALPPAAAPDDAPPAPDADRRRAEADGRTDLPAPERIGATLSPGPRLVAERGKADGPAPVPAPNADRPR